MTETTTTPDPIPFVARRRFTSESAPPTSAWLVGAPRRELPVSDTPKETPNQTTPPSRKRTVTPPGPRMSSQSSSGAGNVAREFGPLSPYVGRQNVTDVFVNGANSVWVDRGGGLENIGDLGMTETDVRALAVRLISIGGRHIDEATPCVDVRLPGSIRVHAVLPPISAAGTLLSIRIPSREPLGLTELDFAGFFAEVPLERVKSLIDQRENVLISGASGAGKTTFLGALLGAASESERIVAIEDVAELRVEHPHFVSLEARQANVEGTGGLGVASLVREALRMRPDRLVVGECRGAELRELLSALNTGHDGGAGTLHANSLQDVPSRLEALGALAGLSATAVARQAVSAIGAVLHVDRIEAKRQLTQVGRLVVNEQERLAIAECE